MELARINKPGVFQGYEALQHCWNKTLMPVYPNRTTISLYSFESFQFKELEEEKQNLKKLKKLWANSLS